MKTYYKEDGHVKVEVLKFFEPADGDTSRVSGAALKEGFLVQASAPRFPSSTADIEKFIKSKKSKKQVSIHDVIKSTSRKGIEILPDMTDEEFDVANLKSLAAKGGA